MQALHARAKQLIQKQIAYHEDELEVLRKMLNGSVPQRAPKKATAPKPKKKGGRVRRSREDLEGQAQQVVKTIKGSGAEGISSGELMAKHKGINFVPSVTQWLKKYAKGGGYKTKGKKQFTRFHAA